MRLIHTKELELSRLFVQNEVPDYVILSHRWGTEEEEVRFADMMKGSMKDPRSEVRKKSGFAKVQGACEMALRNGYEWLWIDSCCIDKSSSAELQEAINSMWRYYEQANICYTYMADVPDAHAGRGDAFGKSEWFTRGWTLQELIASTYVEFFAKNWEQIGTKFERYEEIADITSIDWRVLLHTKPKSDFTVAEKMSWAAHRMVTREEDESYSLMGLFDVNMPLIYGEGRRKAFGRLQEAIYNSTVDQSIFLFHYSSAITEHSLLADSPTRFCEKWFLIIRPLDTQKEPYAYS
ncbi:HET-domain-containing protein [Corynespora cassiicola Philippines]|uniref:HET-domain-containing protein n=1 Tax=Corynespora cassiicola Philippines TaxID=1448308 RepID=A0A2T2NW97_CORCC|nr:HET-domain-containing protein [Corynespora cassiicola Philippines]